MSSPISGAGGSARLGGAAWWWWWVQRSGRRGGGEDAGQHSAHTVARRRLLSTRAQSRASYPQMRRQSGTVPQEESAQPLLRGPGAQTCGGGRRIVGKQFKIPSGVSLICRWQENTSLVRRREIQGPARLPLLPLPSFSPPRVPLCSCWVQVWPDRRHSCKHTPRTHF